LPSVALAVLVGTLVGCHRIARAHGHLPYNDLPVISALGSRMPEHAYFRWGFTLLATVMALAFVTRARMLALEPRVVHALGLRAMVWSCSAFAALSMGSMLVMAWIPDGVSPLHFVAALATFGALAVYELTHASLCIVLARPDPSDDHGARPPHNPGALVRAWLVACPFIAIACVYAWVAEGSVVAQYAAVAMQFAYFLPLTPAFAEPTAPARAAGRD
jgi:hypothetical protein